MSYCFQKKYNHCTIETHPKQQHYWTHFATFDLEKTENETIVQGIVGPRPNLWASFMVLSVFSLASFTIFAVIGTGMLSLNKSGLLLFTSPASLLLFVATYLATQFWKKKATHQTKQIKEFIAGSFSSDELSPK
jgi:uncharacterized membrane protein